MRGAAHDNTYLGSECTCENVDAETYFERPPRPHQRTSSAIRRGGPSAHLRLPRGPGDEGSGLGRQRRSPLLMAHKWCACAGCRLAPFHLDARPLGSQESRTTPQPRPTSTGPTIPPRSPPPLSLPAPVSVGRSSHEQHALT